MVATQLAPISVDEYFVFLEASDVKLEYWDGKILSMAGASANHCTIETNLLGLLWTQLHGSVCSAFGSNQAVSIPGNAIYVFPYVSVACGGAEHQIHRGIACLTNPLLLAEITYPSTEKNDRLSKLLQYTRIRSAKDYLVVEQDQPVVMHYSRRSWDEVWHVSFFEGLDATIELGSVGAWVALKDLYEGVQLSELPL